MKNDSVEYSVRDSVRFNVSNLENIKYSGVHENVEKLDERFCQAINFYIANNECLNCKKDECDNCLDSRNAEDRREYYSRNKEKIAEYRRKYYSRNKEKFAEYRRKND